MIPIPTLALVQASSTACCKGGLHGYRSAMTSTIRWKFLNHWNGLLFAGVEYAFKRKGVDFCIHNFGRWIFTFGSVFFDQTKGGLPVRSKSLRRILQDFFPKKKMPWFFCRGLVLPLFCEGFFRIFSEAGNPRVFFVSLAPVPHLQWVSRCSGRRLPFGPGGFRRAAQPVVQVILFETLWSPEV